MITCNCGTLLALIYLGFWLESQIHWKDNNNLFADPQNVHEKRTTKDS